MFLYPQRNLFSMSSNKFLRIQTVSDFDRERRNRVFLLVLNGLVHNQLMAADQNRMAKHSHIVERDGPLSVRSNYFCL